MQPFTFATTPRVVFGAGSLDKLPEVAGVLGPCILIVTDQGHGGHRPRRTRDRNAAEGGACGGDL